MPHGVVDGVDGMRRKVREVLQAGADWIKLCTSGGVLSPGDLPDHAQFSVDEIRVAVAEAAVVGKRVMAHAMSPAGIRNALVAGVTSIEHGCLLDEEGIAMMKEKGAYLVPTLVAPGDVIDGAKAGGGGLPPEMVEKAERIGGAPSRRGVGGDRRRGQGRHGHGRGGRSPREEPPRARSDGPLRHDPDAGDRGLDDACRRSCSVAPTSAHSRPASSPTSSRSAGIRSPISTASPIPGTSGW